MTFPTTNWTLLAMASMSGESPGQKALADLCEAYRRPIEVFLTARGYRRDEVQDLVQEFFLRWLKGEAWKRADRTRGRFRNFLLGSVVHMLAHDRERKQALKRGGGLDQVSLDELLDGGQDVSNDSSEAGVSAFDRAWAHALIANTLEEVRREMESRDKGLSFEILKRFLPGPHEPLSFDQAAQMLGTNANALKSSVHRLRERFRGVLRATVARTVSEPHEIDEELVYLHSLLLSQPVVHTLEAEKRNTP